MKHKLILATRNSNLALIQSRSVVNKLNKIYPDLEFEIVALQSTGDIIQNKALSDFSQTGIFVKKLESALLKNQADFAVHSLKDLPALIDPRFILPAFLKRDMYYDVLVSKTSEQLLSSNKLNKLTIGTSSLRRSRFLKKSFSNWNFRDIRGNVDTRIKKLKTLSDKNKIFDGIVLSQAGLVRLQKNNHIPPINIEVIPLNIMVPSPGQGCIVIECLNNNFELIEILKKVNDENTKITVMVERKIMEELEGGCHLPFGCLAVLENNEVIIRTMIENKTTNNISNLKIIGDVKNINNYITQTIEFMKNC